MAAQADAQAEVLQREIDVIEARLGALRKQRDWYKEQVTDFRGKVKSGVVKANSPAPKE